VTVNDSGDAARVFTVDLGSGRTVGVTRWAGPALDAEALAPGGPGEVWVGDIGDNGRARSSVTVTRVPFGRTDTTVDGEAFDLTYPDGPADAEALLSHPRTGRLYVVSKEAFGGTVYEAPAALSADRPNRLRAIGEAPGVVTDGSFFPDGRHLLVRNYGSATVYTFPRLEEVGSFELPAQQQGEGISVAPDGQVYASSEGVRSPLLRIALPDDLQRAIATGSTSPSPSATPEPASPTPTSKAPDGPDPSEPTEEDTERDAVPWVIGGLVALVGLLVLLRSLRPN
jgi:hypothetical protein